MLSSLSISRKLIACFAVIGVIVAAMMITIWSTSATTQRATTDAQRAQQIYARAMGYEMAAQRMNTSVRGFLIARDQAYANNFDDSHGQIQDALGALDKAVVTDADRATVTKTRELIKTWQTNWGDRLMNMARQGRADEAMKIVRENTKAQLLTPALVPLRELRDREFESLQTYKAEQEQAFATSRFAMIAGGLALLVVVIGALMLLTRAIAAPVSEMTGVMKRLAANDFAVTVPGVGRHDEIGAMADAVEVFRTAGIEKQKADEAKKKADAEQRLVVETLESGLGKLAVGDLTAQITAEFSPSYATVKSNFNDALVSLRALIGTVAESAATIRTGSSEIAQASEDLARRTESNAASLEETSAAVTQMDERLRTTAQAASSTVERANGATRTVSSGRAITDEAVQAMTRVSESAKGIDSVIEGLDKIAFQTRVLAMNAAVEAGRAGEAGRGFAVVADLVSALAMRSEEEASRARDQLTSTQTDIVAAVEMVQKVDSALADISSDVGEVHGLLERMAADNQAQSSAITQISVAIGTMDQSTQQNAAMVEETSAAARNLSGEVQALSDQAAKFKVDDRAAPIRVAAAPAPRAAVVKPVSFKPASPVAAPAMANGGMDDWASF